MDVDGTMYNATALRRRMLPGLCWAGWPTLKTIRAYRRALETLRHSGVATNLQDAQVEITCRETGYAEAAVRACIRRWMEEAPLQHLPSCIAPNLHDLLAQARRSGIRLAACSDYPALAKLEALQVGDFFRAVVCAQDPRVGRFKPHPRMLEVALEELQVPAAEALFIGDRPEVDGVAAERAGVRYVNVVHGATFRQLIQSLGSSASEA